jgi:hypothetical protein
MASREAAENYDRLIRDFNEERAAALRRIAGTLESLVEQLHGIRDRIEGLSGAARAHELDAYRAVRRRALRYRWYLEVQREAVGLRNHQRLEEFYAVPDDLDA